MSEISILAIDLAKNSFHVWGVKADGVAVFNKSVSRSRLIRLLSDQKPCIVAMEACATSHHWGRVAQAHCHKVRIIPAIYVKPTQHEHLTGTKPGQDHFQHFVYDSAGRP